jgi:uncharacterized SAM-binding protein YcdF (DUF218 family)
MFLFLSKFLPIFVYPVGLAVVLLVAGLLLRKKPRWLISCVIIALAILWLGGNSWVATSLVRSLEWRYLPPQELPKAEVIVLLSGGTQGATYPRPIVELNGAGDRVIYAAWLYHQGVAPHLLLTGGDIQWLGTAETPAEDMLIFLEMLGVPPEAIWLETESLNTYENALFSRRILEEKGIDRIVLVTSAMHMPRSVALFEKQGFEVIPAPTDFSVTQEKWDNLWKLDLVTQLFNFLPGVGNLEDTTGVMKEYIGMLVYRLRGWM